MKTQAYFVPSLLTFIPLEWAHDGTYPDEKWPSDAVLLSEHETAEYWLVAPPEGKMLGAQNGQPVWVDIPPPTQEELIAITEREKQRRLKEANDFMNGRQWPGKAALGRLKGDELVQYNLWLDYLDALEILDISTAPDVCWPKKP